MLFEYWFTRIKNEEWDYKRAYNNYNYYNHTKHRWLMSGVIHLDNYLYANNLKNSNYWYMNTLAILTLHH